MSEFKITSIDQKCYGHGDFGPEVTVACEGMKMDYKVGGYYASQEEAVRAAEILCEILNHLKDGATICPKKP